MGFTIPAHRVELRVGLVELAKVKIHEEIIPSLLRELTDRIKADGVAKHPVIVDLNTLVVLDGMHRVAALKELGCKYLPACLVDYRNPHIYVGCWYRVIHGDVDRARLLDLVKPLGIEARSSSPDEALEFLETRGATVALLMSTECHVLKGAGEGIRESYTWISKIEKILRENGLVVSYETEGDARRKVRSGEVAAVLMTPRVKKEEVIEAAISGNLFAHKTTRHVIPARPMGVDVPLQWLQGDMLLEEVNRMVVEHLSRRVLRRLPRGSIFEGRRYEEELYIFQ